MKNGKYFILLFGYTRIQLFTEVNGKITNIDFANGQNKLSNCVTFSYDREDLEFLPYGDPFEVDQNSSFSDYLDFAGYHFESSEAVETIVASLIDNKLIPNLNKNDNIFLYLQAFRYESKDFLKNEERVDVTIPGKMIIKGHNVYSYDAEILYHVCSEYINKTVGSDILIGHPFTTIMFNATDSGYSATYAPTMEKSIVEKVMKEYPLPTNVPEKLLRNIRNKIFVSKLLDLPLPKEAIYQNRKIDIAKTNLYKHFDTLLKEVAKYFLEKTEKVEKNYTFIFDYGMHPVIKESFLSCIAKPIFMDKEFNNVLTAFMLRNMMNQHIVNNDPLFKKDAIRVNQKGTNKAYLKYGNALYFDPDFIDMYIKHYKKTNILSNLETKELGLLCQTKIDDLKDDD